MKTLNAIFFLLLINTTPFASQFIVNVELRKGDGIIFNQSGELEILKNGWMEQKKFDFSLELGNCPTVCGVRCPLDILSKSTIYIYISNPAEFPLFGRDIDLLNGDFDTSAQYFDRDSIRFSTIELVDYSKYYIFKSTLNKYFLFIIDSLTVLGGCPPEQPLCCDSYGIGTVYGRIILQTNGLPTFDQPARVSKSLNSSVDYEFADNRYKIVDIQGRSIKDHLHSRGIQLLVREDNRVHKTVVTFPKSGVRK